MDVRNLPSTLKDPNLNIPKSTKKIIMKR